MLLFGFTTLTSMAQTTPNTQSPTTAVKPAAAPVQTTSAPVVATVVAAAMVMDKFLVKFEDFQE